MGKAGGTALFEDRLEALAFCLLSSGLFRGQRSLKGVLRIGLKARSEGGPRVRVHAEGGGGVGRGRQGDGTERGGLFASVWRTRVHHAPFGWRYDPDVYEARENPIPRWRSTWPRRAATAPSRRRRTASAWLRRSGRTFGPTRLPRGRPRLRGQCAGTSTTRASRVPSRRTSTLVIVGGGNGRADGAPGGTGDVG